MTACRGCDAPLGEPFLDLGRTPLANAYVRPDDPAPERTYPLRVALCPRCLLVQLTDTVPPDELFRDYAYFTSFSDTALRHAEAMAATLSDRLALGAGSRVLEVASNDGYLLAFFQRRGIPVLGVEPARNIAAHAEARGVPTLCEFFGPEVVDTIRGTFGRVDLLIGNNVLAHVPSVVPFLGAARDCLGPTGLAVFEFPSLERTISASEFDTIYHEHVFYLSLQAIDRLAARAGLELVDVETHAVQGESLRVFLARPGAHPRREAVTLRLEGERAFGLTTPARYAAFATEVAALREELRAFLGRLRGEGKRLAAYGAPAKGNTLLNYCGLDATTLEFTVDRSPFKQGRLLPGSRIPILPPEELLRRRPNYTLILPWNLAAEIVAGQAEYTRAGGRFILPVPRPHLL